MASINLLTVYIYTRVQPNRWIINKPHIYKLFKHGYGNLKLQISYKCLARKNQIEDMRMPAVGDLNTHMGQQGIYKGSGIAC